MTTSLAPAADRYLARSRLVVPRLPGGPDLLGRDAGGYGQRVDWWWADDRRLVVPAGSGVLVATDPRTVDRAPLRLHGCERLLLVDAGEGGRREVREAHDAEVVLTRSRGVGLLGRPVDPAPGAVPGPLAALVGRPVTVEVRADDAPADVAGTLVAAGVLPSTHLVLVVSPRLVVVLRGELAVRPDGDVLHLEGGDGRVTWVPDDGPAVACRPASLVLGASA